jgi:hypothetical protein
VIKGLDQAVECLVLICAFNSILHSNQKQWVHVTSVNLIEIMREEQVSLVLIALGSHL